MVAPEALADLRTLFIFCFSNSVIASEQGENLTSKLTQMHYLYFIYITSLVILKRLGKLYYTIIHECYSIEEYLLK